MNNIQEGAVATLRQICTECKTASRNFSVDGCTFEARQLDRMDSIQARYGIMESSDTIGQGLVTVMEGGLDGKEWNFYEYQGGVVRSRSRGGYSKRECGFDPQKLKMKRHKKILHTEKLYIHREECMTEYIGSILQGPATGNFPVYFNGNSSLESVRRNTDIFLELFMYDMAEMALALDGSNILGDYTGDQRGTVISTDVAGGPALSTYPHYDGVLKQALQQGDATYYPMVELTLPTVDPAGCFFVAYKGSMIDTYTDGATLVAGLNSFRRNTDTFYPLSATLTAPTTVLLIGNHPEDEVYGPDAFQVFYSADCTLEACGTALVPNVLQCPMGWSQSPLLFKYTETLTAENFRDYFLDKIKEILKHIRALQNSNNQVDLGRNYIAIDPLLLIDRDIDEIKRACSCDNAIDQTRMIDSMLPEFVPVQALVGTGFWYWTYTRNIIFLTNTSSNLLQNLVMDYDEKCGQVWSKTELLGNILVVDFNKFATNACDSFFHQNLHAPYETENLPHYCRELRKDCNTNCNNNGNDDGDQFRVSFNGQIERLPDQSCNLTLNDASILPGGDAIDSVVWTVYFQDGTTAAPAVQTENVVIALTEAQCDTITFVDYAVTTVQGDTENKMIPADVFTMI